MQPDKVLWTRPWYYFGDVVCATHTVDRSPDPPHTPHDELVDALLGMDPADLQSVLGPPGGAGPTIADVVSGLPSVRVREQTGRYPWDKPWPPEGAVGFGMIGGAAPREALLRPDRLVLPWPLALPETAKGTELLAKIEQLGIEPPAVSPDPAQDLFLIAALDVVEYLVKEDTEDTLSKYPVSDAGDAVLAIASKLPAAGHLAVLPTDITFPHTSSLRTDQTEFAVVAGNLVVTMGRAPEAAGPTRGGQKGRDKILLRPWPCGAWT